MMNNIIKTIVILIFLSVSSLAYCEDPDAVADRFIRQKGGTRCDRSGGGDGSTVDGRRITYNRSKSYDCFIGDDIYLLQLDSYGGKSTDPDHVRRWQVGAFEKR